MKRAFFFVFTFIKFACSGCETAIIQESLKCTYSFTTPRYYMYKLRGRCKIKYDKEINKKKKKINCCLHLNLFWRQFSFLWVKWCLIKELISTTTRKKLFVIILLWANDCFVVNDDDGLFFSLNVNMFFFVSRKD